MALPAAYKDLAEKYHRLGLEQVRSNLRRLLSDKDTSAPRLAEVRDLSVGGGPAALPARLYRPEGAPDPCPAMLFFHGGGFVISDVETHDALCRRLAEAARIVIVSVDYRLAPEAPFPAQLEDGLTAAHWLFAHAGELGIDEDRVVLGGDSAGAYIAAKTVLEINRTTPRRIHGQLLIYPLVQLSDDQWASSLMSDSRLLGRLAVQYIRSQLGPEAPDVPSLLDAGADGAPATVMVAGGPLDPCRPDTRKLADALEAGGAPVTRLDYGRLPHGFANLTHMLPAARQAVQEIGLALGALAYGPASRP